MTINFSPTPRLATLVQTRHPRTWTRVSPGMAVGMLLLAAVFWGGGNVANKTLLADIGPFTALSLRAMIAVAVLYPLLHLDGKNRPDAAFFRSALLVSALFILAATFQQMAYQWTTVTNVSFLVNTCTVMTPVLAWVVLRQRPAGAVLTAGAMTLLAAGLMSGSGTGNVGINPGDAVCLASALFYAGAAIALNRHAMRHGRPFATTCVQFAVMAVVLAPVAVWAEAPTLQGVYAAGPELVILAVFSSAGACTLTTIAQRHISASSTVIILSLESVFGGAGAFLILGERASTSVLAGGLLILVAAWVAVRGSKASR